MEPFDNKFDELIRQKMSEPMSHHDREIEQSKPFVWTAVQQKRAPITWWHLAAAVVLVLLSTGATFILQQNGYNREMTALSQQVAELQQRYVEQEAALTRKENEVDALGVEMARMEQTITESNTESEPVPPVIIYKTDTVYLKQVEYITRLVEIEPDPEPAEEVLLTSTDAVEEPFTDVIYPSRRSKSSTSDPTMKLRIGSLTAQN